MGCGGGQIVSGLAFYSKSQVRISLISNVFILKKCSKRPKISLKSPMMANLKNVESFFHRKNWIKFTMTIWFEEKMKNDVSLNYYFLSSLSSLDKMKLLRGRHKPKNKTTRWLLNVWIETISIISIRQKLWQK